MRVTEATYFDSHQPDFYVARERDINYTSLYIDTIEVRPRQCSRLR